jgi:hypothetical protein
MSLTNSANGRAPAPNTQRVPRPAAQHGVLGLVAVCLRRTVGRVEQCHYTVSGPPLPGGPCCTRSAIAAEDPCFGGVCARDSQPLVRGLGSCAPEPAVPHRWDPTNWDAAVLDTPPRLYKSEQIVAMHRFAS